jgi:hypothetical protein
MSRDEEISGNSRCQECGDERWRASDALDCHLNADPASGLTGAAGGVDVAYFDGFPSRNGSPRSQASRTLQHVLAFAG